MDLYIQESGVRLSREKNHFVVKGKEETKKLSVDMIESIIIQGKVSITSDFVALMVENAIPIYFSDYLGRIYGKVWTNGLESSSILRRKQLLLFQEKFGRELASLWISIKIERQRNHLLKILHRKSMDTLEIENFFTEIIKKIKELTKEEENFKEILLGFEGMASRYYYQRLKEHIPSIWKYTGRINRGATDAYNIVLNYLFGVLYIKVEHALVIAGLDLKIGVLHGESRKADSLLFDFIENFRFLVWEVCFSLFSKKLINKSYFDSTGKIGPDGKKVILSEFYKKLKTLFLYENINISYEDWIKKEARKLAKEILEYGE